MRWADRIAWDDLLETSTLLDRPFYARPAADVARDLLGKVIIHRRRAGRIIETEAYLGAGDLAAHSARGVTPRTRVIFGPPGHAYVYFIYGMYECLNVIAEPEGTPGCVLIRALEPLCGLEQMRRARPTAHRIGDLASGPGRLTLAMGISRRHYGADLTRGSLTVRRLRFEPAVEVDVTPRVGIRQSPDLPLRFLERRRPKP